MLAVGGDQGVYLLDAKSGAPLGPMLPTRYLNTTDPVAAVRFSPDGTMVAEMDEGGRGTVWALSDGHDLGHFLNGVSTDSQPEIDFADDGSLATTGDPGLVYDAQTVTPNYPQPILENSEDVDEAIEFAPDGGRLAVATENGVEFRDPFDGEPESPVIPTAGAAPVVKLAFSPDGSVLAGGRADGSVQLWDASSGVALVPPLVGASRAPLDLAFTSDDHHLVEVTSREIVMFDTASRFGDALASDADEPPGSQINALAVSPNQKLLAAADSTGALTLWDVGDDRSHIRITTDDAGNGMWAVVFENATTLVTAGDDGTVRFWNATNGSRVGNPIRLTGPALAQISTAGLGVGALATDKQDDALFAFTGAGSLANIDPAGRGLRQEVTVEARQAPPIRLAVRSDGAQIAVSGPTGVELLDRNGRRELTLAVGTVDSLAYAPRGDELAVGLNDGRLLVIDSSRPTAQATPLVSNHGGVWSLAFDPSGSTLAAGGQDGTVSLWDLTTLTEVGPALSSQSGDVSALAFVDQGHEIVAGAADGTVVTYDIGPRHLQLVACAIAHRNLTRAEWTQYMANYPYHATCNAVTAGKPA